jgi:predicted acylesterase/phospholipase RssA/CRP-like cAMP-binding protein
MIPLKDLLPIAQNCLFKDFDRPALQALSKELDPLSLSPGQVLFHQGDPGDSLYLLLSGRLSSTERYPQVEQPHVFELVPGTCFGELALLTGQPRSATVAALDASKLAMLSRPGLERLAVQFPELIEALSRQTMPLMRHIALVHLFGELFSLQDAAAIDELQSKLEWRHLDNGEVLFRQGDPGDAMYLVVSGRLRFVIADDQLGERRLGEASAGEYLGEFALFTDEPRAATVYAVRASELLCFSRPAFEYIAERYPKFLIHVSRSIIKHSLQVVKEGRYKGLPTHNIALLPLQPGVPLRALAHDLAQALSTDRPLLYLNQDRFNDLYGLSTAANSGLTSPLNTFINAWLNEQEQKYAAVIYETDSDWSPWTLRCLQQADTVLLVGESGVDPEPGEMEINLRGLGLSAQLELVLLHPAHRLQITGTSRWLAPRLVRAHHHVRQDNSEDIGRLARRLSGRAVGLVLGGGGARGFAHLGVIRLLEEQGIPVDMVGGTSMGALLGALTALDYDYEATLELAKRFASPLKLFDPTFPVVSFLRSEKVTRIMQVIFKDIQIEDLWRPYYCVASNLTKATQKVHWRGSLWKTVRSSLAIPGLFSPILYEGDLLVDGAVLNNLPVDVMVEFSQGGPIIGVNVFPEVDLERHYRFGPSVSGWEALFTKVVPLPPQIRRRSEPPLIFESLMRVVALNDVHAARVKRSICDLYINPPVEKFGLLEFQAYPAIIEMGYSSAMQAIAANPDSLSWSQVTPARPASQPLLQLERTLADLDRLLSARKA